MLSKTMLQEMTYNSWYPRMVVKSSIAKIERMIGERDNWEGI